MMHNNLSRWLAGVTNITFQNILKSTLQVLFDRNSSLALSSAGLVIHGGGSTLAKTGAADQYLLANGLLQKIAAATDMPALVGSVANATFNVFCFFIDQNGVVTSQMGTPGTTLALLQFPQLPVKKALIGFIIIAPTGTGPFVGGTTALDDGTVVPGAVYVNALSGWDPFALIGRGHVNA